MPSGQSNFIIFAECVIFAAGYFYLRHFIGSINVCNLRKYFLHRLIVRRYIAHTGRSIHHCIFGTYYLVHYLCLLYPVNLRHGILPAFGLSGPAGKPDLEAFRTAYERPQMAQIQIRAKLYSLDDCLHLYPFHWFPVAWCLYERYFYGILSGPGSATGT